MKENITKDNPKFPCLNLSIDNGNDIAESFEIIWDDDLIHVTNKNLVVNKRFVDLEGNTFTVVDIGYFSKWRRYLPFFATGRLIFSFDNKVMSVSEVKEHVLRKLEDFKNQELISAVRNQVVVANSYESIFKAL